jgi:predicted N-acyltransferase
MATDTELRKMARDFYARARASRNPFTKRKFRKAADDYIEEAEQLRRSQNTQKRLFQNN